MSKLQGPRSNFFFKKRQRGANLWQESTNERTNGRDARIARNRPQEATCIESTSGRSSLACMLGTQMTMGRQTRRVRTTRALWFWWSGIGTQPFHELAHTHTTLHHHLATRRTHAHAQHKILATHIIARMRGSHSRSTLNVGVFFVIPVAGAIPHTHPAPPHLHRQVRPDAHL